MFLPVSSQVSAVPGQSGPNASMSQPDRGTTLAEPSPSRVRPETSLAIDPARAVVRTQSLREREAREYSIADEALPPGPQPAFKETFLEQRARLAFEIPVRAEPQNGTEAVEDRSAAPTSVTDERRLAEKVFRETAPFIVASQDAVPNGD